MSVLKIIIFKDTADDSHQYSIQPGFISDLLDPDLLCYLQIFFLPALPFKMHYIHLPASGMCGIKADHVPIRTPPAVDITSPA